MVVILPGMGADFNHGKGFAVNDGHREFMTTQVIFRQYASLHFKDPIHRSFQVFFLFYDFNADGGTFAGRFQYHGE